MKKRWKPFAFIAFILVAGSFIVMRRPKPKPAPVLTAKVQSAPVARTVSASGKIQPFTTIDVKSKAGGTILSMAVEEGTRVKVGDLICLIDRRDNLASYKQAQSDVESAQAGLESAEASADLQNQTLGPQIRQAEESVESSKARITSAKSALAQQKETLDAQLRESATSIESAKIKLAQAREEAAVQPSLSQTQVQSSQASVAASRASLASAKEALRILSESTFPQSEASAKSAIDQAKSNLEVAQRNLERQKTLYGKGFVARNALETAQNQQEVAQAALDSAQVKLDTLQADFESQKRDAQSKIDQAQANLEGAQANLGQSKAQTVQVRLKKREVDSALASLRQAQASYRSTLAQRALITQKEADLQAENASLRSNQAALQSARANVLQNRIKQADIVSRRAALQRSLEEAQNRARNLAQTTVVAPSAGVVLQKYVDKGAIIQSGDSGFSGGTAIVQLANVNRVYVAALVDESDIADIRPGQKVNVSLDAYPDQEFVGRVRKIFPQAQLDNNITTVKVQVEIPVTDARLRPNLNATCDFELENRTVLSVPAEAVHDEGKRSYVTVIVDPTKPTNDTKNQRKQFVTTGTRGDERVEIKSGLKSGEQVVLTAEMPTPQPQGGPFE